MFSVGKQLRFRDWSLDSVVAEATTDPKSLQIKGKERDIPAAIL